MKRLLTSLLLALYIGLTLGATAREEAEPCAAPAALTYVEIEKLPEPSPAPTAELVESAEPPAEAPIEIDAWEAELIAKTLYGECRGCPVSEQELVVWCILNRVDAGNFGDSVEAVITAPYQFLGYAELNPVTDELYAVAVDVLTEWETEKQVEGYVPDNRLPGEFLWFSGDGVRNYFRDEYVGGRVYE